MDSISVDEVDATVGTKPKRPGLKRETSTPIAQPPPPSQPPPAPPPAQPDPTDSLSLPQLRQLVNQFPKTEQTPYAFEYRDAEDFEPEIDEWFHYTETAHDRQYLLTALEAFEHSWKQRCKLDQVSEDTKWTDVDNDARLKFLKDLIDSLSNVRSVHHVDALSCVYYILMGVWSTTSGLETKSTASADGHDAQFDKVNTVQVQWIHKGVDVVCEAGLIPHLLTSLIAAAEAPDTIPTPDSAAGAEAAEGIFDEDGYRELSLCLSCFYILVESARDRSDTGAGQAIRRSVSSLQPNLLVFLVGMISRLRWDDTYNIPLMHALQLFWKALLLLFGKSLTDLARIKSILQPRTENFSAEAAHPILTTSPLAYHAFKEEITSKYPAYKPPPNIILLDIDQKFMLPPLTTQSRNELNGIAPGTNGAPARGSILHQPVHIATPAPSPPPSPVGPGGKAGKKQNYQTVQNFPFLFPPLDETSDNLGGKGSTQVQDTMVAKKWQGSSVPLSIVEAGELFASRMRLTRSTRQLYKERDLFMKYERGWTGDIKDEASGDDKKEDQSELESLQDAELQSRLQAVDDFFHLALPNLQSLVIVMMKVMLTNVQDIALRNGGAQDSAQSGGLNRTKSNSNMTQNQALPIPPPPARPDEMPLEDLDNVRSREISQKAIAGALFLLAKWFKISHVLKFEYLAQLLLDSNYVQLTLKYFAHQNLEDLVAFKYDRDDLSLWHYCHVHSDHPPLSPTGPDERSDGSDADEAVPPPIARHRRSPTAHGDSQASGEQDESQSQQELTTDQDRPSVDEMGNPLGPVPQTSIKIFSFRQFQTSIHLLRILQKVTRGKSHRIMMLVHFKSSQILRRVLRVPDQMLRLYVLKLFKSQVPYCGRKWRSSNMRVITAIYLHCRPELRDDWLAGMHDVNVEADVDEAVPLEWALRGLTFWWQKRKYPDHKNGINAVEEGTLNDVNDNALNEVNDNERDFFQRELDAMGWGLTGLRMAEGDEDVVFGEDATNGNANGVYPVPTEAAGHLDANENPARGPAGAPQWAIPDAATLDNWQNS